MNTNVNRPAAYNSLLQPCATTVCQWTLCNGNKDDSAEIR